MRWRGASQDGGLVEVEPIDVDETGAVLPDRRTTEQPHRPLRSIGPNRYGLGNVARGAADGVVVVSGEALQVVDAAGGEFLWTRPVSASGRAETCLTGDLVQGTDVVVCMAATGTGEVVSTVLDAATGYQRLTIRHPGVLLDAAVVDEDTVTVLAEPDGTLLVSPGAVRNADGSERFRLPAPAWVTEIDDGFVPGVLLVLSTDAMAELQGPDALTGDVLWTSDVPVRQPLARVDGVALVRDGSAVVAVRITDGRELWRVATDQRGDLEALTDGQAVVLVRQDETGRFLAGHRVQDGMEAWREALPGGARVTAQG